MKTKLKFGLGQVNTHAPKWIINSASVVALFIAAKHYLITDLPGIASDTRHIAMMWFEYGLNIIQVLLALGVIFLGQDQQSNHDTTGNINN